MEELYSLGFTLFIFVLVVFAYLAYGAVSHVVVRPSDKGVITDVKLSFPYVRWVEICKTPDQEEI